MGRLLLLTGMSFVLWEVTRGRILCNVSSCMVNVMEGEGWSDGFGDVLWSGLGISRRARKIGLVVHRM